MSFIVFSLSWILALVLAGITTVNTDPILVVSTDAPTGTCEPIEEVDLCLEIDWPNASFPNLREHTTQIQASQELNGFVPLIERQCSNAILHFLCGVYAPLCVFHPLTGQSLTLKPCREVCEYVRGGCEPLLIANHFKWPEHLDCKNFPAASEVDNTSIETLCNNINVSAVCIPGYCQDSIQPTNPVIDPATTLTPSSVSLSLSISVSLVAQMSMTPLSSVRTRTTDSPVSATPIPPARSEGIDTTAVSVVVVILVAIAAVVLVIVTLAVIGYKYKKSKMANQTGDHVRLHQYLPHESEMLVLERETPAIPPNSTKLLVIMEDSLEFGKELGTGAFGTVYEGYWKPDTDENKYHVAIKVIKNTSPMASRQLLQEGVVMGSMDHENIVRLYCVCMSKQLLLVSQFVPLGALLDYLKHHRDHMSALSMLEFTSQIALGMAYLESKRLVHCGLAARNVLVQSHRKVKIADFGLTRILETDQEHCGGESLRIPVRWLPPESIRNRVFTHKTDVWSYGVTVWEVLTFGALPYQGKKPYEILKQLEGGRRLDQPMTCTIELYGVLLECWLLEPESRPSFEELHKRMVDMSQDPCRFVLTVQDGNANDYNQLPSNEKQENEAIYETPFSGDPSLDNTLPSNASSINPYTEQNSRLHSPKEKEKVPFGAYKVAVESPKDPRYVEVNVSQSQPFPELPPNPSGSGYNYNDTSTVQHRDTSNKQQKMDNQTSLDNGSSAEGRVVPPIGSNATPTGGFHNPMYDSTVVGGAVPPVDDYETLDDENTPIIHTDIHTT